MVVIYSKLFMCRNLRRGKLKVPFFEGKKKRKCSHPIYQSEFVCDFSLIVFESSQWRSYQFSIYLYILRIDLLLFLSVFIYLFIYFFSLLAFCPALMGSNHLLLQFIFTYSSSIYFCLLSYSFTTKIVLAFSVFRNFILYTVFSLSNLFSVQINADFFFILSSENKTSICVCVCVCVCVHLYLSKPLTVGRMQHEFNFGKKSLSCCG